MSRSKVAVITGGAGGVGGACARRFGGDHVLVISDVHAEPLDRAAEALRADGYEVIAHACDVSDPSSVAELASKARAAGPLGVLVNAAGLSPSMTGAYRIIEVNLFGTINVLDAFIGDVTAGSVAVCIASIAGWRRGLWRHDQLMSDPQAEGFWETLEKQTGVKEFPGLGYALSKRGVILLVERRADEWGARGGRLVSVSPGLIIDSEMGKLEAQRGASGLVAASALKREARADDIAGVCALLASPDASYVTGVDLRVDGGSIPGYWYHAEPDTLAAWENPTY